MAPDDVGERLARVETSLQFMQGVVTEIRDRMRETAVPPQEWVTWRREVDQAIRDLRTWHQRLLLSSLGLLATALIELAVVLIR